MAENKNEVAESKATAISTFDDSLLSGGTGLEETTTEDFAIPFKSLLQDYKEGDYLLLIGDPAAIGVACSIAAFYNRGKYSILKWDRQEGLYYPVDINLHQKGEIDE